MSETRFKVGIHLCGAVVDIEAGKGGVALMEAAPVFGGAYRALSALLQGEGLSCDLHLFDHGLSSNALPGWFYFHRLPSEQLVEQAISRIVVSEGSADICLQEDVSRLGLDVLISGSARVLDMTNARSPIWLAPKAGNLGPYKGPARWQERKFSNWSQVLESIDALWEQWRQRQEAAAS